MIIDDPAARVRAFIADWHAQWRTAKSFYPSNPRELFDFDRWRALVREVDERHFVEGRASGSDGSFSVSHGDHDESAETIESVERDGERAIVQTICESGFPRYYEYELTRERDGDFRIAALLSFLDPPGHPLIPEAERGSILSAASADAPLAPLPPGVVLDVDTLFADGREVRIEDRITITAVDRVGALHTASGILGVRDFGYDAWGFAPLARSVPPGTYPVDVVIAFGRNAAVRVVFDERAKIARWHPAAVAGGGHVVGVDAGNVGIFDVASFVRLEARAKERLFLRYAERHDARPRTALFAMSGGEPDCVVLDSGFGDGGYPCYFGADESGRVVALLVDFLILAEFPRDTVRVPWPASVGAILDPELDALDVELRLKRDGDALLFELIDHAGKSGFQHLRVLDERGEELLHSDRLSLRVEGSLRTMRWDDAVDGAEIELSFAAGYRHV